MGERNFVCVLTAYLTKTKVGERNFLHELTTYLTMAKVGERYFLHELTAYSGRKKFFMCADSLSYIDKGGRKKLLT